MAPRPRFLRLVKGLQGEPGLESQESGCLCFHRKGEPNLRESNRRGASFNTSVHGVSASSGSMVPTVPLSAPSHRFASPKAATHLPREGTPREGTPSGSGRVLIHHPSPTSLTRDSQTMDIYGLSESLRGTTWHHHAPALTSFFHQVIVFVLVWLFKWMERNDG